MERLLKYGLLNNELKHISLVDSGLACNCFCPACRERLVAKKGDIKEHHFAHHDTEECKGAFETALHLLAKLVLSKAKRLTLPNYHFDYEPTNRNSLFKEGSEIIFEFVILERQIDIDGEKIIPDAIGVIYNKEIFIEFANTHFVDNKKKEKMKGLGIACVEINLSEQLLDETALANLFQSNSPEKYWIINPRLDKEYIEHQGRLLLQDKLEREKQIEKYNSYKANKNYRLLTIYNGEITNCPKKTDALNKLKATNFYRYPVLKSIIDGQYWNGEMYGRMPNGKWIFLNGKKVTVFPPNLTRKEMTQQQQWDSKKIYAGLKTIQETLDNSEFGDCGNCKFSVDHFSVGDKGYEVCKHSDE